MYSLKSRGDWRLQLHLFLIMTVDEGEGRIQVSAALSSAQNHECVGFNNNIIYLLTAIGLSPGGSGYFTCIQNMKLVTNKFKSGGLHEKHVVATGNVGNRLSVCL